MEKLIYQIMYVILYKQWQDDLDKIINDLKKINKKKLYIALSLSGFIISLVIYNAIFAFIKKRPSKKSCNFNTIIDIVIGGLVIPYIEETEKKIASNLGLKYYGMIFGLQETLLNLPEIINIIKKTTTNSFLRKLLPKKAKIKELKRSIFQIILLSSSIIDHTLYQKLHDKGKHGLAYFLHATFNIVVIVISDCHKYIVKMLK